jgi:hypothetical protein
MDPSLGAPPVSVADPAAQEPDDRPATAEEVSLGRRFLYVALILIGTFGLIVGLRLAIRMFRTRQERLLAMTVRGVEEDATVLQQQRGALARMALGHTAPPSGDQIRDALDQIADPTTLYRVQSPAGNTVVDPGGAGTPAHVTSPVDLVDHTHRLVGRLQPGNLYRSVVTSGNWTLVESTGGTRGWVPTNQLHSGGPPEVSLPHAPPTTTYRLPRLEVHARPPGDTVALHGDGTLATYHLTPPDSAGIRQVYDAAGSHLGYVTPELQARWLPPPSPPP